MIQKPLRDVTNVSGGRRKSARIAKNKQREEAAATREENSIFCFDTNDKSVDTSQYDTTIKLVTLEKDAYVEAKVGCVAKRDFFTFKNGIALLTKKVVAITNNSIDADDIRNIKLRIGEGHTWKDYDDFCENQYKLDITEIEGLLDLRVSEEDVLSVSSSDDSVVPGHFAERVSTAINK